MLSLCGTLQVPASTLRSNFGTHFGSTVQRPAAKDVDGTPGPLNYDVTTGAMTCEARGGGGSVGAYWMLALFTSRTPALLGREA